MYDCNVVIGTFFLFQRQTPLEDFTGFTFNHATHDKEHSKFTLFISIYIIANFTNVFPLYVYCYKTIDNNIYVCL